MPNGSRILRPAAVVVQHRSWRQCSWRRVPSESVCRVLPCAARRVPCAACRVPRAACRVHFLRGGWSLEAQLVAGLELAVFLRLTLPRARAGCVSAHARPAQLANCEQISERRRSKPGFGWALRPASGPPRRAGRPPTYGRHLDAVVGEVLATIAEVVEVVAERRGPRDALLPLRPPPPLVLSGHAVSLTPY